MAQPRASLGVLPCLSCSRDIPVKQSTGGGISVCCPWCDLSAYAKQGTEAHRRITARLPTQETAEQAPPTQTPKPQPAKKSAFPWA